MTKNIDVLKLLQKKFGFDLPNVLGYGLNVRPGSKALITVYLCLGCEITLYGVLVLYCDMQVLCVGLVSIVLMFGLFRFILLLSSGE